MFYPVHSATVNEGKNTEIELTIEKKQKKTEAKIKRTPFEEDNHISSAWMRPKALPMSRGPRCLRVLSPLSEMIVTNLTEPFTGGKVLEGTVNRIIFKLKAGPQENCTDVKFRVTCSSLLISAEGKTKKISSEESDDQENNPIADMKNPCVRTPVLVTKDESSVSQMTEYGYAIPSGWSLVGNGQGMILDNYNPAISTLKSGESTYAYFDVYRPPPNLTRMDGVVQDGINQEDLEYDRDMCQTDIDISVCYRQTRTSQNSKKAPPKRRARSRKKKDEESDAAPPPDEKDELVYFDHSVAVLWSAPILAVFSPGMKQTQPSGNRHPSNNVPDPNSPAHSLTAATKNEMVLIDGERVLTKCAFEAVTSADGLLADIEQIKFEVSIGLLGGTRFFICHLTHTRTF